MTVEPMPAAFLGHGSPMNALERNRYTNAWRELGARVPRPRGILAISAHWYVNLSAATAMDCPKTIHDFYGFPDELSSLEYPAPGDRALAEEIAEIAKPTWVGLDHDSWGFDHGTWSVLAHAFPNADVPVVQLSINAQKPLEYHLELGAELAPLRQRGVLVICSGNVVHNLRRLDFNQPASGFDWADRFDDAVRGQMASSPEDLVALRDHKDYADAVPTPDHFIPLLYLAGLASAGGSAAEVIVEGYVYGSQSMTCYTIDANWPGEQASGGVAAALPDPDLVPPDDTNA